MIFFHKIIYLCRCIPTLMYANHASFCLDTPYFMTITHACNQKVTSVHYTLSKDTQKDYV